MTAPIQPLPFNRHAARLAAQVKAGELDAEEAAIRLRVVSGGLVTVLGALDWIDRLARDGAR